MKFINQFAATYDYLSFWCLFGGGFFLIYLMILDYIWIMFPPEFFEFYFNVWLGCIICLALGRKVLGYFEKK